MLDPPLISVIIPVGPAHAHLAGQAVASALTGSVGSVEVIVINDSGRGIMPTDPQVRVIPAPRGPGLRPALARNAGLAVARGTMVVHLDADDYLLPGGLATLLRAFAAGTRAYVYGLHYGMRADGTPIAIAGQPVINSYGIGYDGWDYTQANLHAIPALVPRAAWAAVGGFDPEAPGWDDWTGFARLRRAGLCGEIIPLPTFVYRIGAGQQHHVDNALGAAGMEQVRARIRAGGPFMPCRCGSDETAARQQVAAAVARGEIPPPPQGDGMRILEYIGPGAGTQTFTVRGRAYRAGNNASTRYLSTAHTLREEDIPALLALGVFRELPPPEPFTPPPDPAGIVVEGEATTAVGAEIPGDEDALAVDGGVGRPTPRRAARARGGGEPVP